MKTILLYISYFVSTFIIAQQKVQTEEITIHNDSIVLPGTLSYTPKSSTLAIWIHGSGNIDRTGQQGAQIKANYIAQVRQAVVSQDIAFFSYDKRTATPKNLSNIQDMVFEDLVEDAQKVIQHFQEDARFKKLVLIGHSQGSLIAMLASKGIHKIISIAGPSMSIDQTIVRQVSNQNEGLGKMAESHFKELMETGDIKQVNPFLGAIFAKQNFSFLRSWAQYDPLAEIQKVSVPILIINGKKDLQVSTDEAEKLHQSARGSSLVILDNMNHILMEITKDEDNMKSYFTAGYKISDSLINTIIPFLKKE